ncbi:helix-turn-helix transcriptional regulator [Sulfitobacter guttiformis]|uniref:Transcriptional regulator n=1 Tax=Sulfitobacter guttiformis TaxID=74349 RepID=A0A420DS81_9RHOB|nr:helix-turn-helix transcriptional regulator [Sulfitobacter guttiformis]KIN74502.1 Transcriptional regulator [Sulfitobacter guttiformis KCTC 32187]RKE97092.1 transcriptional regulator [Sulfitobacter guttiformis]
MQHTDILNLCEDVANAKSDQVFWDICAAALSDVGVSGFGFGIIPHAMDAKINGFSKAGFFKHTYSPEWAAAISDTSLLDDDITVELIIDGKSEIFWNDPSLLENARDTQLNSDSLEKDLGMEFGVSMSLGRNAAGSAIAGIGLWAGDVKNDTSFVRYWQEYQGSLRQISHILDEGIRGQHGKLLVELTQRESDCLTYLAVGLRPADICWRLRISEKTFEKYVRTAKDKLCANTRDHAIAKALVLNLIRP